MRPQLTFRARVWAALTGAALFVSMVGAAYGRDNGQWEAGPAEVQNWYRSLTRPDMPTQSCCGLADAYWADSFTVVDGKTVATITDDRIIPGRPTIAPGTKVIVPDAKLKWDQGNPTGHGVIFLNQTGVLCYVTPGGV